MSICGQCGGEMMEAISCKPDSITIDGMDYEPIRWGEERRSKRWPLPEICSDCATPVGGVHHPGCCVERCPACLGQALGCPCFAVPEDDEDDCGYEPLPVHQCRYVRTRARRCPAHLFRQASRE
jgi:hypothetical protein